MRHTFGLLLILGLVSACNESSESTKVASEPVAITPAPTWEAVSPGGDTLCSDGSEFRFYVREGDPEKLLFYLQGGGACWMRSNCDPDMQPSYNINLENFDPQRLAGIFDRNNPQNPFADYSIVFAPYCSGDVHIGASDTVYPPAKEGQVPLTVHHRGFANAGAALDLAANQFGDASHVFVTGSSAGAIPAPYYAIKAAQKFPAARITQLGDAAGGYRRREGTETLPHAQWGTVAVLGDDPAFAHFTNDSFNYEALYIAAAKAYPDIQFARYDAAEDAVQRFFLSLGGQAVPELKGLLDANNQDIRREIANFSTYVAGGDSHTILGRPEFYSYAVGEHSVRDWVTELALGRPVADVSCIDCRLPDFIGYDTPDSLKDLWMTWQSPDQRVDAFRIFDNVAYIGIEWVAAYVIETSEGLILIDSLYGNWLRELPAKFEQLGLDSKDIKYVIVTHGHFDHAGGAADFQRRYNAKIVMTEEDWALAARPADHPLFAFPAPRRDIVAKNGDVIELGDTRVELFKTPGHTEGVLSLRYQVRDGDNTHTAVTLGGVGLNFSGVERTRQYIDSYERLQSMQEGVEVSLPNHAAMGRVFERRDRLSKRNPGDRHPFVDARAYQANLAMFLERAREKLEKEQAGTADEPMAELQKAISN